MSKRKATRVLVTRAQPLMGAESPAFDVIADCIDLGTAEKSIREDGEPGVEYELHRVLGTRTIKKTERTTIVRG